MRFAAFSLLLFLTIVGQVAYTQPLKVSGKITNTLLQPLPYATVQIREEQLGKYADEKGNYSFALKEGKYDIVVSLVGYKTQTVTIILSKKNLEQNIMLEPSEAALSEANVTAFRKDRAADIVRKVIQQKEPYETPHLQYSCDIYIKATIDDTLKKPKENKPAFNLKKKQAVVDSAARTKDSAKIAADSMKVKAKQFNAMSLAEVFMQYDYAYPGNVKEVRTGVKRYGNISGLFYLTTTKNDFNFYKNLINVPDISSVPFLSPFSYSGLLAYKFRTQSIYYDNGQKIYRIKIIPVKLGNALVSGEAEIIDSLWVIKSCTFQFPNYHLPEYDFFKVSQQYTWVNNRMMLADQQFNYEIKFANGKSKGNTQVHYSNFDFNKTFPKKYFSNELGVTTDSAYHRDSTFWNNVRTIPLDKKEVAYIRHRDSIYTATHSERYLDSLDKATNKITFLRVVWDGLTFNNHHKEQTVEIAPLLSMYRPGLLGGSRVAGNFDYQKRFPDKQIINGNLELNYGFRNQDLKGSVTFSHRYNSFSHSRYSIYVSDNMELINENDAWINLLQRSNFYQARKIKLSHSTELLNGLVMINNTEFAVRRSVANYQINPLVDSLYGDVFTKNKIVDFPGYNAFYLGTTFSYTPAQKYLREPRQKIILGSRYPTFRVSWRKGIPGVFSSDIDFDFFEFGISQRKTLGLSGVMQYNFSTGKFITSRNLKFIDARFMRQGDPFLFSNPTRNFQLLDSTFAVKDWFYEGHLLHEFNGALLNKVPLVKKLKLLEVAGGGVLYAPERKLVYVEGFAGLEKTFRIARDKYKIGVYLVGSVANKYNSPFQIKIGLEKYNTFRNSW